MEGRLFCAGGGPAGCGVGVGEGVSGGMGMGEGRGREGRMMLICCAHRSLLYLEGEASMSKFTGKDGNPQQSLNIVQRTSNRTSARARSTNDDHRKH